MKKPNSRLLLLGSVGALVVVLTVGGTALFLVEERPTFPLPNGTHLRIDGVEYGTADPIVYGPAWKRRLRPLIPSLLPALAAPLRADSADLGAARLKDALTVWLEYNGDWGASSPFCILRDSHGCRFRSADNVLLDAESGSPYACLFPFFPRREALLQVDTYLDMLHPRRVGTLTVPSPVPTRYPSWRAEALPITRRSGPISVTLTDVTTGWCRQDPQRVAGEGEPDATRLGLQIAGPVRGWKAVGVTLSDAMGGNHRFEWGRCRSFPGQVYVPGSNLCREESAYRFRLEFSRAETEGAVADRQYPLGSLEACLRTARRQGSLSLPDGRKLQMSLRRQADEVLFSPDRRFRSAVDGPDRRRIVSGDWKPADGELGRLWVTGELHRRPWRQAALTRGRSRGAQTFRLILPLGLVRPQLYFGTYRSRFVTFTVKPQWVTP